MTANYHTHTWRCRHAFGTEREYVENAIAGGLRILGFSDHAPMPYEDGYDPVYKMRMDELEDYAETILALKEEYKDQITIYLGFEAEYYPKYFDGFRDAVSKYPVDYLILGQHFLGNEIGEVFSGSRTADPVSLIRYCAQCKEAMDTGCFTYIAHPDLINYVGDDSLLYEKEMRSLCEYALAADIPLEINFLGLWQHRNYPNPVFWKIAGEVGNTVIFGSDAHEADRVWDPETLEKAVALAEKYHLHVTDTVEFRRI